MSNLVLHFSFFIIFYLSPSLYLQCCGQAYAFLVPVPLCLAGCLALQIINPGRGTRGPMSLSAPQPLAGSPQPTGNAQPGVTTRHLQVSPLEPWQNLSHSKRFLSPDPEDIDVFLCAHLSTKRNCFLFIPFAHMIFQDCYAFFPLGNFRTTKEI